MIPVRTVFIDGLKPESVEYMEFLNTFEHKKRIKTELGAYSPVCYASMYTGVFPNKHLLWFTWKYSPDTSPFKLLKKAGLHKIPHNIYSKRICYKTSLFINRVTNPSVFGFTVFNSFPLKYWSYFDTEMKKPFTEPDLLNGYSNIFDILRTNGTEYEIVGTEANNLAESSKVVEKHSLQDIKPWTYYFVGDIDPLSHRYGQDSPETIKRLQMIDKILEEKYKELGKRSDNLYFMVFSDHGHAKVENTVNLKSIFRENGTKLEDFIHFLDANYARFWFRNEKERKEVEKILSMMDDKGFILSEEHMKKCHVDMPDNRYGDLIFYLDKPNIFKDEEISVLGRKAVKTPVTMHGYLPDYLDSDAVLIANKKIVNKAHIKLEDITPSILQALGIEIPDYMDGEVIWK